MTITDWLHWTTVIFNIFSILAFSTGFLYFILNIIIKRKNLKLFNQYKNLTKTIPIICSADGILKDNYAGYDFNLNPSDKNFNTFNLFRLLLANTKIKHINQTILSFMKVYNETKKSKFDYFQLKYLCVYNSDATISTYKLECIDFFSCKGRIIFKFRLSGNNSISSTNSFHMFSTPLYKLIKKMVKFIG